MAQVNVPVKLGPVNTREVDAALARIQSAAKGVDFGNGARSLNKLSRPLGKITGQADEFQKSLEASNARVLAFGASVVVINKLSQAFSALVTNTVKVEASFKKIGIILGGTEKELRKFGDGIFKVAQRTATSFDEVAEGALELARQGLSVEESLSRVETALKLVRVAGIDSQQAVAGLTAAIKGFQGSGLTVAQIADKLAEVDTKFAVSTEDLINGLERASASARVAGVNFDELLAVVTTVQERTQRGGAVIGNAFKTIFARLSRQDTLKTLRGLGIATEDLQGNLRGAIPVFLDLAAKLDEIGLRSKRAAGIIQDVAGVRQRDILISLVEDLTSAQSQFTNALNVSRGAVGALDRKNAALNDTLEALINNLVVGSQKLSSVLGEIGFTDAAKNLLKIFGSVVNGITDLLEGEGIGSKFARGFVKGVGAILTGPGVALVGAIFTKLFVDLAKFGMQSLKSLLGINSAAQQQNMLQQSILQTILQNENIQRELIRLEGNKIAQEQLLLRIYNDQANAMARMANIAAKVTPGVFGAGFRGGAGGVTKGRAADGYVAAEKRDVSRGVGGASPSSSVVSIPNFNFGGGKRGTMVANSSEYFVPNFGGADAIFTANMASGGLPSGARKIRAARGFAKGFGGMKGTGSKKSPLFDDRFAMITPSSRGDSTQVGQSKSGAFYGFPVFGFDQADKRTTKAKNNSALIKSVEKFGVGLASQQSKIISGGQPMASKVGKLGNAGSVASLAGVIFEAAVSSLLKSPQYDLGQTATFDFVGTKSMRNIKGLYPNLSSRSRFIEAKIGGNKRIYDSMANKMEKFGAGYASLNKVTMGELMAGGKTRGRIGAEFGPSRRGARGYIGRAAVGSFSRLDTGKTLHGGAAASHARKMGYRTALNSPATSSAPAGGRGTARMSAGGAFTALIGIQTAAIGVTAALTELEGPAANVGQGLTSMLNGLMSAGFILMAFTGPIGIAVASITALVAVTDGLFKIFNDGKGVMATFMDAMFGAQIAAEKRIKELQQPFDVLGQTGNIADFLSEINIQRESSRLMKAGTGAETADAVARSAFPFDITDPAFNPGGNRIGLTKNRFSENDFANKLMVAGADAALDLAFGGPANRFAAQKAGVPGSENLTLQKNTELSAENIKPISDLFSQIPNVARLVDNLSDKYNISTDPNKVAFALPGGEETDAGGMTKLLTDQITAIRQKAVENTVLAFEDGIITPEEQGEINQATTNELEKLFQGIIDAGEAAIYQIPDQAARESTIFEQIKEGASSALEKMNQDSEMIFYNLGEALPQQLSDGLAGAFDKALDGSESLGDSLRGVANEFLETIQKAFLQKAANAAVGGIMDFFGLNSGGMVPKRYYAGGSVGSGTDTVPAMLTGGEFVMKKGAVEKYGTPFMEQLNAGAMDTSSSVAGGVSNSINVSFNITSGGEGGGADSETTSGQSDAGNNLVKRLKESVTTIVAEESRPGGQLYNTKLNRSR